MKLQPEFVCQRNESEGRSKEIMLKVYLEKIEAHYKYYINT